MPEIYMLSVENQLKLVKNQSQSFGNFFNGPDAINSVKFALIFVIMH